MLHESIWRRIGLCALANFGSVHSWAKWRYVGSPSLADEIYGKRQKGGNSAAFDG
jgi:hypothetical protein